MDINKNLHKKHKPFTKCSWRKMGIKFTEEEFEFLYGVYLNTFECQLNIHASCSRIFKSSRDRQMDHDHKTGLPRAVCCQRCNNISDRSPQKNTSGHQYISTKFDRGNPYWRIQIPYNSKRIQRCKSKRLHSLESVVKLRNELYKKYNLTEYISD